MKYLCLPEDISEANQLFDEMQSHKKRIQEIEFRLKEIVKPKIDWQKTEPMTEEEIKDFRKFDRNF